MPAGGGRLRRARDLLAQKGFDVRDTVLACYGATGFDTDLTRSPDPVLTIGLDDLYQLA